MAESASHPALHHDPHVLPNQAKEAFKDIFFGSAAGIVGKYIEYPFDTVKVRLQSQPSHLPPQYRGPLDCFKQSIRRDGVLGLYRGISAPLVGAAVETSSLFFSYRLAQDAVRATMLPSQEPLPLGALVFCGSVSGAFTSLFLTPIELIKCKMQVPAEAGAKAAQRLNPLALVVAVYRQDGVLAFWRGQLGTFIRETGGSAAWFGGYEGTKMLFRKANAKRDGQGNDALRLHQQMVSGAVAGMSYNFLFYPADTIKSCMQTEEVGLSAQSRRSFGVVAKTLWQQQGIRGLYRGCGITVARSAPASAFIFTVYETLRTHFG